MRKVYNTSRVPAGGYFVYVNPEDGHRITNPIYDNAKAQAKKYRTINHYPIGLLWDEAFESNICANALDPDTCIEFTPPTMEQKLASVATALWRAAKSGFKTVNQEELEQRQTICRACNFYGGQTGLLKIACKKCGCSSLKQFLKSQVCPVEKW